MSALTQGAILWGFIASAVMATILQGSQSLGLSRLNLPYLIGSMLSGRRRSAMILGVVVYILGGWGFAFVYFWAFQQLDFGGWWLGGLFGLVHGLVVITLVLPWLPLVHPRMAAEYAGPDGRRRLEPPGSFGLNYGRNTPLITLLAQTTYGLILGAAFPLIR